MGESTQIIFPIINSNLETAEIGSLFYFLQNRCFTGSRKIKTIGGHTFVSLTITR